MVKYVASILPHVHFRGDEYAHITPSYAELGFRDAEAVGAVAIAEQPNPQPVLTSLEAIRKRRESLRPYNRGITHRVHMGLTTDLEQVRNAFEVATNHGEDVYAVKAFWTHSTGMMGLLDPQLQKRIWQLAGSRKGMDYRGIIIQHLEDEKAYRGKFDPSRPITHSQRQHEGAELIQTVKQLGNAYDARFKGIFYVAHASSPATIDFLNEERSRVPFDIIIETTGHHEFLNTDDYRSQGNMVKMNPPVREEVSQRGVLQRVVEGKTDIIGDDHAPHPILDINGNGKNSDNPPSGIPAILFLPKRVELLRGLGINESHLESLLFGKAKELFGFHNLAAREVEVEYRPDLWQTYGWNPFSRVDGTAT